MAIVARVEREQPTGLRTKSVFVLLLDDAKGEAREVELTNVALDADAAVLVETMNARELFNRARQVERGRFERAARAGLDAYFASVLEAVDTAYYSGATLAMALAAGLVAVGANPAQRAVFDGWRAWMGLTNPETLDEQRLLLMALVTWALRGLEDAVAQSTGRGRGRARVG